MITAETIRRCSYLDTISLENLIRKNYPRDRVHSVEFVGITTGEQFAYNFTYHEDGEVNRGRVYVTVNSDGKLVADY